MNNSESRENKTFYYQNKLGISPQFRSFRSLFELISYMVKCMQTCTFVNVLCEETFVCLTGADDADEYQYLQAPFAVQQH